MKKALKIIRNIVLGLLIIIILFIGGSYLNHQIRLKSEAKKIENYGEKLAVFDGDINVTRMGTGEGKQAIILFPGYGTATPYYDFLPLTTKLSKDYEVIVVEPFGYGLSSETKRERSIENIVEEMHEVIQQLDVDNYVLGGHSITGIYGIDYMNRYPDEPVAAFLGVDTSTPQQEMTSINMTPFNLLKKSGLFRLVIDSNPSKNLDVPKDDPNLEQIRMLTLKNSINNNLEQELDLLVPNFEKTKGMTFPEDLPVILFVAVNDSREGWIEEHREQANQVKNGKTVELKGNHYLHRTQSEAISKEAKLFLDGLNKK